MARPKGTGFQATEEERQTVRSMSVGGIPQDHIAAAIRGGISEPTLRKHFRRELDLARDQITCLAVGQLVRAIGRGEPWAICFYLKCRAGWSERQALQVTGEVSLVEILKRRQAKNRGPRVDDCDKPPAESPTVH
jgi:hypothetical protein